MAESDALGLGAKRSQVERWLLSEGWTVSALPPAAGWAWALLAQNQSTKVMALQPHKRNQEAAEFEKRIERAIRKLFTATGKRKMPTKTRVAEELGIGGEGTRLNAFNNKLRRDGIDYAAIAARVKLHK